MKAYLKCDISEGMFSSEKIVVVKDINGEEKSGFFPNSKIEDGLLKVEIYAKEGDKTLVGVLGCNCAGYGFMGAGSKIWVKKELIIDKEDVI